jgi:hypothetical protein
MKKIKLTGKYAVGDYAYCYVSDSEYDRVSRYKWFLYFQIRKVGNTPIPTIHSTIKNKTVKLHRFIMNVNDPEIDVDHINYNRLDNTNENLRLLTKKQHSVRRRPRKGLSSQYLGVSFKKQNKKWESYIHYNYKKVRIGYFNEEIDAAKAYDTKAKELHGEFANLNFPSTNEAANTAPKEQPNDSNP